MNDFRLRIAKKSPSLLTEKELKERTNETKKGMIL